MGKHSVMPIMIKPKLPLIQTAFCQNVCLVILPIPKTITLKLCDDKWSKIRMVFYPWTRTKLVTLCQ